MNRSTKTTLVSSLISVAVVSTVAIAGNVTLPYTFSAGTLAKASEVNANFAAVKTANDDNQTQITALAGRVNGVKLFHPTIAFTFPGPGTTAQQTTAVDVPIFTASSDGVVEFRLDVSDVNAYYTSGSATEVGLFLTPVINSTPGIPVTVLTAPLGQLPQAPISGHIAFAVSTGALVAVRITFVTYPYCSGGRGGAPNCTLGLYATARFSPGVVLQ